MKTSLKNALRVSVLCTFVIFASCGSNSGGAGGGGPVDPPPTALPKINSFTPTTSTVTITYTGMPNPGTVNFSWETANGFASFDGTNVPANGSSTVSGVLEGKDYTLRVINGSLAPAESTRKVIVAIDPVFSKIVGTIGKSWKMISATRNGTEMITPCQTTFVYTWYPNCKSSIDYGSNPSCGGVGIAPSVFTFDVATSTIIDGLPSITAPQTVIFTSATTMEFRSTSSDGLWNYVRKFTALP